MPTRPGLIQSQQNPSRVLPLLQPYGGNDLIAYPVTMYVNSPRNDDPGCLEPRVDDQVSARSLMPAAGLSAQGCGWATGFCRRTTAISA